MNPLKELEACGQSPWLDFLKRSLIKSGALVTLIDRDGLKGMTSNPSIFEKAIAEGDEYTPAIEAFLADGDHSVLEIYEHLAIADIRAAADALRSVYAATDGRDGYVSLECSPYLANDTDATVAEALRLWKAVDRPNLMIKVPATQAGIPAIRDLIGRGLNINITLLFSVDVYAEIIEAYLAGLEALQRNGGAIGKSASVASFFISRIDSAVDKKLDQLADQDAAKPLRGKIAIANAKQAYALYKAKFSGPRWQALAAKGAKSQRLLWASTGTKNPAYADTLYVDTLIGRDTVNTLPPATMDAFRDHGRPQADAIETDLEQAPVVLSGLEKQGISLKAITEELTKDGVKQFVDAFDQLFGVIAQRRQAIIKTGLASLSLNLGTDREAVFQAEIEAWRRDGRIRRLWQQDISVWSGTDENKWLGWLNVVEREMKDVARLQDFARWVKQSGFSDVALLGMGGSSLGPEVLAETFGRQSGWPRFHMLDSTDPAQVRTLEKSVDLGKTLFIVSSKSGSTLEPNSFMDYFFDRAGTTLKEPGKHFVAVTDPGSSLEKTAKDRGFAHIFYGDPSIGGRYSVLSKFGLVPAAAIGLDVAHLLNTARTMVYSCQGDVPPKANPGVALGVALGVAATKYNRDKVTIIATPAIADIGAWLEQLIAESTGKHGKALIPVADEPLRTPAHYGSDRIFAYLELTAGADKAQRDAVAALEKAGHPVIRIVLSDTAQIVQEFFRWEIATAVAGAILRINPFDQPDVEASKKKTSALTKEYEKTRSLPAETPIFRENGITLYADAKNAAALGRQSSLSAYLKGHFTRLKPGDYAALLAYIERNPEHIHLLTAMRTRILDKTRVATCVGFGPRFLHSTGQAYKGGPNTGVFLQITCDDPGDLDVPGHGYSFGLIKAAQARGDLAVLEERDRRALRVHLSDVKSGLADLTRALEMALA